MAFVPFHLGKDPQRYQAIIDASKVLTQPLEQRWGR
jgi:hypothetical protein